ncbi:translation initiation factor IF-2 N-terminal domain-containing protein, partial [Schaalia sp.]|uniref:translation initiation factor IF-2 N-terminal domain-containing protein n=1 Tax=Schaalia sp. TaxID=2691890 RepID=UPI003D111776
MAKLRVHELAKELGITSKELLAYLKDNGEFVKASSSALEPPVVRSVREHYGANAQAAAPETAAKESAPKTAAPASKPGAPKPGAARSTKAAAASAEQASVEGAAAKAAQSSAPAFSDNADAH